MQNKDKLWRRLADEATKKGGNGDEIVEAYKELYSAHSDGICSWLGGLFDSEIGGFYYSNSARDNEYHEIDGVKHYFLPDIESTNQATNFLQSSGMIEEFDEIPEWMRKKMIEFNCSLQDPDDGFIYHPQWGKSIRDSRRGRDMAWSIAMEEKFNFKLPYKTAIDRLKEGSDNPDKKEEIYKTLPDHLKSKEAFLKYLEAFDWDMKAYPAANTITSQRLQIEAAGLMPIAVNYVNSIQNPDGTWGKLGGYHAVNAILKLGGVYENAPMPNPLGVANAAMDCITLDTRVDTVCWQYNAWFSLRNVIGNLRKFGDNKSADGIVAEILKRAPAGIISSAKKVRTFTCEDGSYSYTPEHSSSTSQASRVSLGLKEGDVNATVINCTGVIINSLRALELKDYYVPVFDKSGFEKFLLAIRK